MMMGLDKKVKIRMVQGVKVVLMTWVWLMVVIKTNHKI